MKKFLNFIKEPPWWFLLIWYIFTVAAIVGSVLLLTIAQIYSYKAWAILVYAFAAVALGYAVYTLIRAVPKIKRGIIGFLQSRPFTARILEQYGFRTVIFAVFSFAVSVAYVVFNGTVAVVWRSVWYGSLAAYYLLLAVMRGGVLLFHKNKRKRAQSEEADDRVTAAKIYRSCGVGLVILPVALSAAVAQVVLGENSFEHPGMMIYVAALYAFYKIIMATYNIFKARKTDDITVRALRAVSLADSLVSILALQTAMFKEFGGGSFAGTMNAVVGGVVCALTVALGIFVIVKATAAIKGVRQEEENGRGQ